MADQVVLPVQGMSCSGCVASVKKALERAEGVLSVDEVSLDGASARVTIDATRTNRAALARVIEDAGYESPA